MGHYWTDLWSLIARLPIAAAAGAACATSVSATFANHVFGVELDNLRPNACLAANFVSGPQISGSGLQVRNMALAMTAQRLASGAVAYKAFMNAGLTDGIRIADLDMMCWPSGNKGEAFHCYPPAGGKSVIDLEIGTGRSIVLRYQLDHGPENQTNPSGALVLFRASEKDCLQ